MKLYRLAYSPYARKVQKLLDLLGATYEVIDVSFGARTELARVTGGYVMVPVLVDDTGTVVCDSRRICAHLLVGAAAQRLVPSPHEGPIWAYADYCDGPLEDVLFRIASPVVQQTFFSDAWERALYTFVKERKFGPGCVDAWRRDREALIAKGRDLLAPSGRTLAAQPFLFGSKPTLADCALYGNAMMIAAGEPELLASLCPELPAFVARMDAHPPL